MIVVTAIDSRADVNTPWYQMPLSLVAFNEQVAFSIENTASSDQKVRSQVIKFRTIEAYTLFISNPEHTQFIIDRSIYNINNSIVSRFETTIIAD